MEKLLLSASEAETFSTIFYEKNEFELTFDSGIN